MTQDELQRIATAWAAGDPDGQTAEEVRALLARNAWGDLGDRFGSSLEFGTAGLRGILGGGTNRMNRAVVRRTTLGLARYLKATLPEVRARGVVIGRDGRRMSAEFCADAAAVLAGEGIPVHVFPNVAPTPLTAFAVTHLGAAAAVMVTASHNPPEYNGYKVYWANGAQIIPPHDGGIATAIAEVGPANEIRLLQEPQARQRGLWKGVEPSVERAYLDAILGLRPTRQSAGLRVVYTAMHGVGGRLALQALTEAGAAVTPVAEQQEPDASFPTVRFPNPEEPGAMDLARATAQRVEADLVLANDPDADRLAVMARDRAGVLRMLSGDEVGVLLGHYLLTQRPTERALVVTTIVSSGQLKAIAAATGAQCGETLTGFKWIANLALEREVSGARFVMGYEEALGYTVGTVVRDKDGIGAAVVVADLAGWCKARGATLLTYLEEVQRAHGLHLGKQYNATLQGSEGALLIARVMEGFRTRPPDAVGGFEVSAALDYRAQRRVEGGRASALSLPRSNVLAWELVNGGRVTMRPSGTEPKIKIYFEVREVVGVGEDLAVARARGQATLAALEAGFLAQARERGLP